MGISVACNPKPKVPETPEIPVEQPSENTETPESNEEGLLSGEAEQEVIEALNQELVLERPERPMQMKYGIPDMPDELIQPWLQISSLSLDAKYAHHEEALKRELQQHLNTCNASIFPTDKPTTLKISLRSGIVTKPLLTEQGFSKEQEQCVQAALWKKRLSVAMSGSVTLTVQKRR